MKCDQCNAPNAELSYKVWLCPPCRAKSDEVHARAMADHFAKMADLERRSQSPHMLLRVQAD